MIKRKIFSIFKNKFLIGTIAFSLVSTATLIPLSNNHNIQKKLDRSHQNDNFDEKKINNVDKLESSIKFDNSNKNIDAQIFYFNENFDKKVQKNFFKYISTSKVIEKANSIIKSNIKISKKNRFYSLNSEKKEFKDNNFQKELEKIIEKIKSGDLSPSTILKLEKEYSSKNQNNYKKITSYILENSKNFEKSNEKIKNLNYIRKSYFQNKKYKENDFKDNESYNIYIDKNQYNFLMNLEKEKNRLKQYEDKIYGFAIASATLTAAAWALSAFYWSAWWMFGANIPFAIASTTQASIMTYFTSESWNNYYDTKSARTQIENYLNSQDYKEIKETILFLLNDKSVKKIMSNSTINFIIRNLVSNTFYPKLISLILKKNLSKVINKLVKYFYEIVGKNVLKNITQKIGSYLSKLALKKSIVMSTSWASPAATVISILDSILSIFDFFGDIALYGIYI